MKDLHDDIMRTDIGPTLAEIDSALLTQCMHITTTSRNDMRKVLTNFVASRHAAAELVVAVPGPAMHELLKSVRAALEIGIASASVEATTFHEAMKGYRKERHDAYDADVAQIAATLEKVIAALSAPQAQPAADLTKADLLRMWQEAGARAYKEDEGEAHEFFYAAVLEAQKGKL